MENKNSAMLVLGVIAVVAVIGLVMMFVQGKKAAGLSSYEIPKVYSGGAKKFYHEYPGEVYAPYKKLGPTKMIYKYVPDQGLVGKAIQAKHFGNYPAALAQVPSYLETEDMIGPLPLREAAALKNQGKLVVYNPNLGGYFYKPSEKVGDVEKEV